MYFNREDYGSRIRSLRKKRGLTQEQLAEKMNVSTPYIAKIETGKQTGPVELAVEFAEFFEVSLDYLLAGKGDFAEEQKRGLRMAISLLSELEASGFRLVNKALVVYEPEATIVRMMFENYLSGQSTSEIARDLNSRGIKTKTGKSVWRSTKVAYILGNERYCGDCKYQKTYRDTTVPFKQFRNRGQEDMFYASMTHAPLIDRDTFDKVQLLLKKRQDIFGKSTTQNIYPLTSRIQCSECGSYFRRRQVSGTVKWGCSKHIQDRTQCNSNYYSEERIYDAFVAMVNKLRFSEYDILGQTLLRLESAELKRKQKNTAAREISRNIADLNAKLVMVEQLHAKGYLKDEVHKAQVQEINDQLRRLKRERQCEFSSGITQMIEDLTRLKKLLEELEEPLDRFDEKLFTEIVQTISISRRDEMTVTLIGGLRFTEML